MNVKSGQCYITAPFPGLPNAVTKYTENIYYEIIYGQGKNVKRVGGGHDRAERGPCAGEGAPRVAPGRAGRGTQGDARGQRKLWAGGGHDRHERGANAGKLGPRILPPGRAGQGSQGEKETCAVRIGRRRTEKGGRCNIISPYRSHCTDKEYYVLISPAADVRLRRA